MEIQEQKITSIPLETAADKTIIVGWSHLSRVIADHLLDHFTGSYDLQGFVSLFPVGADEKKFHRGIPLLGEIVNLEHYIKTFGVQRVVIAVDPEDRGTIHSVVRLCNQCSVQFELLNPDYDILYGQTLQYIARDVFAEWEFSFQRILSALFATILLILFLPVFVIVALLIKLDSPGPIFYSQERVGKNGRIFRIIKFRTMVQDAEKLSGPKLATKNDPRITKVGRFLRKTRLDEIPQLINIILGDMAFIGPRPERPYFVDKYSRLIPFYKNRLKVKPGVTGLAQVFVGYDETIEDVKEKVRWDLYYIERKSIWLDVKILWKTLLTVLTMQGQ